MGEYKGRAEERTTSFQDPSAGLPYCPVHTSSVARACACLPPGGLQDPEGQGRGLHEYGRKEQGCYLGAILVWWLILWWHGWARYPDIWSNPSLVVAIKIFLRCD